MSMAPADEAGHGKGRRYHEPAALADGGVRVTEQDGDQFLGFPNRCRETRE